MTHSKSKTKLQIDTTQNLDVFIIDWHSEDVPDDDAVSSDENSSGKGNQEFTDKFVIKAFGLNSSGDSIAVNITNYQPYFYVKVPDNWNLSLATFFVEALKSKIYKRYRDTLCSWKLLNAKPFYYFTGDERYKFKFIKLVFNSHTGFKKYEYILRDKIKINGLNRGAPQLYERYESNILPVLRFIHEKDIKASGWIRLQAGSFYEDYNETTCRAQVSVSAKSVQKHDSDLIPPLNYVSYDIEADSSHGDFPIAKKDYQKLARDIITEFNRMSDHNKELHRLKNKERMTNKTDSGLGLGREIDIRETLNVLLELVFNRYFSNNNIRSVVTADGSTPDDDLLDQLAPIVLDIYTQNDRDEAQDQLVELFELNLPRLDPTDQMDYYALSEQFVQDLARLQKINNVVFKEEPLGVVRLMLGLAFNQHYDNNNVNVVYPKQGRPVPDSRTIQCIVPSVLEICGKCYQFVVNERKYGRKKTKPGVHRVTQDDYVEELGRLFDQHFPELEGDKVIQIGSVFKRYGEQHCYLKHIIVLDTCGQISNKKLIDDENKDVFIADGDLIRELTADGRRDPAEIREQLRDPEKRKLLNQEGLELRKQKQYQTDNAEVIVESYQTEQEVIKAWVRLIRETDPDLIIGYNIFGFDFKYIYGRAKALGIEEELHRLGRLEWFNGRSGYKNDKETVLKEQKLSSSGLGDNTLYYITMFGRVSIDLYKVAQNAFKLDSYKLDNVCKKFLGKSKNDLPPAEIFIKQKGDSNDRQIIAEYCLIDCMLVTRFIDKLDIIVNNIGMSQVCSVPFSFLFLRGQGIKLLSFVSKICREKGYLLPVLSKTDIDNDESYEGAIVLNAYSDIYFEPVAVADFNSLYPSCMISENLSHDSFVGFKVIPKGAPQDYTGQQLNPENQFEKMLLEGKFEGWGYVDVVYDLYEYVPVAAGRKKLKKVVKAHKICRFAQPPDGAKSIVPNILKELLVARKSTRKTQKNFPKGSFKWNILEGLQLAYKVTANSLYGQIGARTSAIFLMDIAACTTATGRNLIKFSKDFCETNYKLTKVVYGDSVASYTPVLIKENDLIKIVKISDLGSDWKPCTDSDKEYSDLSDRNIMSWTETGWTKVERVIRHKLASHKKMIRVTTNSGTVDVTDDHSLLRPNGVEVSPKDLKLGESLLHHDFPEIPFRAQDQISVTEAQEMAKNWTIESIPDEILNGSFAVRKAFWDNLDSPNYYKNPVFHAQIVFMAESLGLDLENPEADLIRELKILRSEEHDYVYDLTTGNHHFQAGVGKMIVHNTDSVFIKFATEDRYGNKLYGLDAINKSIELCTEAATAISRRLKKPHNLEFEKAIWPFILVSKKRYHGHYYTAYGSPKYDVKSMGIVLKRRDNAKIVKHVFGGMTNIIMTKHSVEQAIKFVKDECQKLLKGEFGMDHFIITKTLRSYYKNPDQIAHNVLANRIGKRDPGNKPHGNDRIPYAYIRVTNPKTLQGDRIETPEFITENKLPLDYRFYLTNQIIKPVSQILDLSISNADSIFKRIITEYDNKLMGIQEITKFSIIKTIKLNTINTRQLKIKYLTEQDRAAKVLGEFDDEYKDEDEDEDEDSDEDVDD